MTLFRYKFFTFSIYFLPSFLYKRVSALLTLLYYELLIVIIITIIKYFKSFQNGIDKLNVLW